MGIKIEDKERTDFPKPKAIIIDGVESGEATPHLYGDTLTWHACIRIGTPGLVHTFLVQGTGDSPARAIGDGIVNARLSGVRFTELLKQLEEKIGTTGKSEAEIRRNLIP